MNAFEHMMNRAKMKPIFNGTPTLAKTYENQDIDGWWWSEKLDGIRAIWNGKNLVTRNNNIINCPSSWIMSLPKDIALDGELYIGRGKFNQTVSIVRRDLPSSNWKNIKYHVFDSPTLDGTYCSRYKQLTNMKLPSFCVLVQQNYIRNPENDIPHVLSVIEKDGGEGLMVRNPFVDGYIEGRTGELLKIKTFDDFDAKVIDIVPGEGKHIGRMGALICQMLDTSIVFKVGTGFNDRQRENPPSIGSIIKFKCMEFTQAGVPRFPVFLGTRLE